MRTIFKTLLLFTAILFFATLGKAQSSASPQCPAEMPAGTACVTRGDLVRFLQADDENKALKAENAAVKQAADGLKKEIYRLQNVLSETSGKLTAEQQMVVRLSAVLDLALKNTRKKCLPFSVCIN